MGSTDEQLVKLKELYIIYDFSDEQPRHKVYLDTFQIMAYEVTNAQYLQCVRAGACSSPANTQYDDVEGLQRPVTDVDWEMAQAFCQWIGGRLPTEAEWEKAARGGLEGRLYPWGDEEPDCGRANYAGGGNNTFCVGSTRQVGSYPANGYGLYDMAGNVWEWTADWYGEYPELAANKPGRAGDGRLPRGVRAAAGRVYRAVLLAAFRLGGAPSGTHVLLGLRCSRSQ